jgi:hypothetical protein
MVAVGAMAMSSELRRPVLLDAGAQRVPAQRVRGRHAPRVELELTRAARVSCERGWAPFSAARSRGSSRAPRSRSPPRCAATGAAPARCRRAGGAGRRRPAGPSRPGPRGASVVGRRGLGRRVEVQVDHAVELTHGRCAPCGRACRSQARERVGRVDRGADLTEVATEVDRAEVADRRLALEVTSMISVQRFERCTTAGSAVWLHARLQACP